MCKRLPSPGERTVAFEAGGHASLGPFYLAPGGHSSLGARCNLPAPAPRGHPPPEGGGLEQSAVESVG